MQGLLPVCKIEVIGCIVSALFHIVPARAHAAGPSDVTEPGFPLRSAFFGSLLYWVSVYFLGVSVKDWSPSGCTEQSPPCDELRHGRVVLAGCRQCVE